MIAMNMNTNMNNNMHGMGMHSNFEQEKCLLGELLKQLGRPNDISWEELVYENSYLSNQFVAYIENRNVENQNTQTFQNKNDRIPKRKTIPCKYFESGNCRFGEKCNFIHEIKHNKINNNILNYKAKEFIPPSGIISLTNLSLILNGIDSEKLMDIDTVLEEIKEDEIVKNMSNMSIDEIIKEDKMEIIPDEINNVIEDKMEIIPDEINKVIEDIKNGSIDEPVIKCDGTCRAKVATTKVRCTAPVKNGTMFCGRHKNYTGNLMQ